MQHAAKDENHDLDEDMSDKRNGVALRFAFGECWLGAILVAQSERGICEIHLGDDRDGLAREVLSRSPHAHFVDVDTEFDQLVSSVADFIAAPGSGVQLPLDIRGTDFQKVVWNSLRAVSAGTTATYVEIANRIGSPSSARAVAQACAANVLAVAIPCHRIVQTDGGLAGYRWGVRRKRALLARESGGDQMPNLFADMSNAIE